MAAQISAQKKAHDDFNFAISPFEQAAAYEALWLKDDAGVKRIAEWVKEFDLRIQINLKSTHFLSELVVDSELKNVQNYFWEWLKKKHLNFELVFKGDIDYPVKLYDEKYPSPVLYYQGAWDLIDFPSVSIVGTRAPTEAGIQRTRKLVKNLVKDGFIIMSGLARGIDTAAHKASIEEGGNTIAVIGTPLSRCYPKENQELQSLIARKHLLISQVPFLRYEKQDFRMNRFFFPERNKTMSALSLATVIVEAGETSGSLIQARAALAQGRKLFILDSCFQNKNITWPDDFEKKGAIRVKDYSQISEVLKGLIK